MKALVTGGLGSLGLAATRELLERGHEVRCLDLRTRQTRRRRRELTGCVELVWGDVCDGDRVRAAVEDRDVVFHCAAILFPDSEQQPDRAQAVNVGGTRNVLAAMASSHRRPALVFPSSISVYGKGRLQGEARRVDDPVNPSTLYSKQKLECEEMIRASGVPWTILRVGAALEPGVSAKLTPLALRTMFDVSLATRIEWVHPRDVARAMVNAANRAAARSKVLMIGGGPSCRATQRDFFATAFESLGIGMLPEEAFGRGGFEMDWMDTTESEALLEFQRHSWADFEADFQSRMRFHRWALAPVRPLVRQGLLYFSRPWRLHGAGRRERPRP